jgi:hypothetical protein
MTMDHAAVQEWLDEGFFSPAALEADDATSLDARAHLATCPECTEHALALRRAALKLDLARGPAPQARERLLATVRSVGRARRERLIPEPKTSRGWWPAGLGWRLAAAALVVGVVGAGVGMMLGRISAPANSDVRDLTAAMAMMADLAGQPGTTEVVLRDPAGNPGGVALVSTQAREVAVFTSQLPALPSGDYGCWFERAGQRTWIGRMHRGDGVEYWAGDMDEAPPEMMPGDRIVIAESQAAPEILAAAF